MTAPFATYILAGGKSRRFGSDKALATWRGVPLIQRLARQLAPASSAVVAVAERADKYTDLGLPTIGDRVPNRGPLGGLLTVFEHAPEDAWCLVVTCDQVVLEAHWIAALAASRGTCRAVAFREAERWHPFPGFFRASLRSEARDAVAAERLSVQRFLDAVDAWGVPLPDDWPPLVQANTPDDLARFG